VPVSILHRNELVGTSLLEHTLDAPGAVGGRLTPGPALWRVTSVFAIYNFDRRRSREAIRRFVREREALGLEIVDRDGARVEGRVDLISDWGDFAWLGAAERRFWGSAPSEGPWMLHLSLE
jgi:hypothetical protein